MLINNYTPLPLPRSTPFIAPFWGDVDETEAGQILFRETDNFTLLARATNEIQEALPLSQNVNVTNLLIATWDAVGHFGGNTDKVVHVYRG